MTLIAGQALTHRGYGDTASNSLVIVSAACLTVALAMAADSIATIVRLYSSLVYLDEWIDLIVLRLLDGTPSLTALFRQHNEERILSPRLTVYTDEPLFSGRGVLDHHRRNPGGTGDHARRTVAIRLSARVWSLGRCGPDRGYALRSPPGRTRHLGMPGVVRRCLWSCPRCSSPRLFGTMLVTGATAAMSRYILSLAESKMT